MKKKLRDLEGDPSRNYDGHHPSPQFMIRTALSRRRLAGPWLALVNGPKLFEDWHINDRYAEDGTVSMATYQDWKTVCDKIFNMANIR